MGGTMIAVIVSIVITLCVVAPITWFIAIAYRKKVYESKIGKAEEKSREIIDEALKVAETKKREALLEAKEESMKTKNDLEKEVRERRAEIQRYERRVLNKEENLEKRSEALAGDRAARNRLTEGHLGRVVELAREYAGQGVLMADLIQEGNIALLMAMETFAGGEFGLHLTKEICSALDAAVAEQNGQENTGNYLASQANAMMKATEELVEELGREATLSEVAERMKLSEEMTRDIMKISMDALSVVEANGGGETFGEGGAR